MAALHAATELAVQVEVSSSLKDCKAFFINSSELAESSIYEKIAKLTPIAA